MPSSCTVSFATTRKPCPTSTSATAGPERSARSPRAQESLTVTTAAVKGVAIGAEDSGSVVEEDIFLLFLALTSAWTWNARAYHAATRARTGGRNLGIAACAFLLNLGSPVALRLIQQAQPFHQQALGIELRSFLIGGALEVEFEIAAGPAQNPEHGWISHQ